MKAKLPPVDCDLNWIGKFLTVLAVGVVADMSKMTDLLADIVILPVIVPPASDR